MAEAVFYILILVSHSDTRTDTFTMPGSFQTKKACEKVGLEWFEHMDFMVPHSSHFFLCVRQS